MERRVEKQRRRRVAVAQITGEAERFQPDAGNAAVVGADAGIDRVGRAAEIRDNHFKRAQEVRTTRRDRKIPRQRRVKEVAASPEDRRGTGAGVVGVEVAEQDGRQRRRGEQNAECAGSENRNDAHDFLLFLYPA